jgi:cellulose synthase operon protein C
MANATSRILRHVAFGCLSLFLVACSSAEERAQNYYKSGEEYLQKGDYAKASVEFRNALKIKDNLPDAWYGMAVIEEQGQNWPKVFGDLNKVLELQPKHTKALLELSRLSLLRGDLPTALANANSAYENEPENPEVVALKAAVLLKLDDRKGAAELADQALKLKPHHADGSIVKATLQQSDGDTAGALATIDAAIKDSPTSLALYVLALSFQEKANDVPGQEKTIKAIVAAFPDNPQFKKGYIEFLVRHGRSDDAEKQLRANVEASPDDYAAGLALIGLITSTKGTEAAKAELEDLARTAKSPLAYWIEVANIDFAAGRQDMALANLQKLADQVGISDEGINLRLNLAGKYMDAKQFDDASTVVTEILKNDAQNVGAQKLKAALLIERRNPDEAITVLREALNYGANDPSIRLLLAKAYENKQSFDLAAKEYAEGYSLSNGRPEFGLELATFQLRRGDVLRGEETLASLASRHPRFKPVLTLLADLRLKKRDWKGAEDIAKMIASAGGDKDLSDQIMGASLLGQKRFDEAINLYEISAAKAPDAIQPMFALVRSYLTAGKTAEAEAFIASALKANPDNANAFILLGMVKMTEGKPDEAKTNFETAIAKDATLPSGYLSLSQYYFHTKDMKKAIAAAESGLGKVKDDTELRMVIAGLQESAGQPQAAVDQYEKLIAQNSDSLVVINNYVSLVSDGKDDEASLKRAAEIGAVLKDSPIPEFQETYGWILVRIGNLKEGLSLLERVNEKLSGNSGAQMHLGLAYAKAKNTELARKHLQIAFELSKDEASKAKIQKAISELGQKP